MLGLIVAMFVFLGLAITLIVWLIQRRAFKRSGKQGLTRVLEGHLKFVILSAGGLLAVTLWATSGGTDDSTGVSYVILTILSVITLILTVVANLISSALIRRRNR